MRKKLLKVLSIPLTFSLFLGMVSGCNDPSSSQPPSGDSGSQQNIPVTGISITGQSNAIQKGLAINLTANITPANATNQNVTWTSDNDNIAAVDQTGHVSGVEFGRTVIKATTEDGGYIATYKVVVTKEGTTIVPLNELVNDMIDSDYQVNETGIDQYGLSDSTIVGASPNAPTTVLFEVPNDNEFVQSAVINVMDITLAEAQRFFEVSELNDTIRIRTAIRLAKEFNDASKLCKIVFPKNGKMILNGGDFEVASGSVQACIAVEGLNGTYLVGNGVTLEIQMPGAAPAGYFYFNQCENLYMTGFILTQDVPTSLTGVVKDYNADLKKITLDVVPEFNEVAKRHRLSGGKVKGYLEFHEATEAPLQTGNFFAGTTTCSSDPVITGNETDGYEITLTFTTKINEPPIGIYGSVYFTQYDAVGVSVNNSKNTYFDDLTMHYASGMGFTGENDENFYLNRFNLVRKEGSKAMVTSTADGTHFSMMKGIVKITNSIFEYTGDDALNIKHGYYYRVSNRSSSFKKQITLQSITSPMPEPQNGDQIAVFNEDTFESCNPEQGYYTVDSCENSNGIYTVTVKERLVGTQEEWGNCRATFISHTPQFEFSNNIVRNKRNRGILVQVPHALIRNNTFNRVGHGSMMISSSMDIFNEATLPQSPTIINNKLLNSNYLPGGSLTGDTAVFAISKNSSVAPKGIIKNVNYQNNFVANNGTAAISLRGTSDNIIQENLFVNIGVLDNLTTEPVKSVISLNNTGNTLIKSNYNLNERSQNLNGIVLRGLSGKNDVVLENNVDLDFEKIEGAGGPEVHISKVNAPLTIDGNLTDWEGINAHDVVFDGYSFADNTRTSKEAVSDHFAINTFKMTYTDTGIYFAFDIFDNLQDIKPESEFWYGDCVEILATNVNDKPNTDLAVYRNEENKDTIQIALTSSWQYTVASVRSSDTIVANKSLIQAKVVANPTGYIGELLIPFTLVPNWKASIDAGEQILMAIIVGDAKRDVDALTRLQVGNVPHFVENYKTMTYSMPQYYFD